MVFNFISVLIPFALFFGLPKVLGSSKHRVLLAAACLVYAVSWYIPSPPIDGRDTAFMTHFFGGGVFCGLVGLYIKLITNWRANWYSELAALYALTSALGVLNELFEVLLYSQGLMPNGISDTSWDLLANTLGAVTFFAGYTLSRVTWRS